MGSFSFNNQENLGEFFNCNVCGAEINAVGLLLLFFTALFAAFTDTRLHCVDKECADDFDLCLNCFKKKNFVKLPHTQTHNLVILRGFLLFSLVHADLNKKEKRRGKNHVKSLV